MTFKVGDFINSIGDKLYNSSTVFRIANNPLYTALCITIVIILIIYFVFRNISESDDSVFTISLKSGVYIFVLLIGAIFIHSKVLTKDVGAKVGSSEVAEVFAQDGAYSGLNAENFSIKGDMVEDQLVPVNIKY